MAELAHFVCLANGAPGVSLHIKKSFAGIEAGIEAEPEGFS